jgi:hypothetical protein
LTLGNSEREPISDGEGDRQTGASRQGPPEAQSSPGRRRHKLLTLGIKEVEDGVWLVTFMDYDLGYIDLEQRTLQPLDNPFGPRIVTHVSDTAV